MVDASILADGFVVGDPLANSPGVNIIFLFGPSEVVGTKSRLGIPISITVLLITPLLEIGPKI